MASREIFWNIELGEMVYREQVPAEEVGLRQSDLH